MYRVMKSPLGKTPSPSRRASKSMRSPIESRFPNLSMKKVIIFYSIINPLDERERIKTLNYTSVASDLVRTDD